jgi:cell division protein FtsW
LKKIPSSIRGTPDFLLLFLTFALIGFGLVMVFSASYNTSVYEYNNALYFTKRQVIWAIIGSVGMLFLMNTHYSKLKKWFVPFFVAIVIMLILVLFIGKEVNGAKSWFGIGPIGGQPSEFAKLGIILYLAALITKKGEKFRDFHKGLLPVMIIVGLVVGLIMLQPDLGTSMILIFCALIVIVAGGANLKHLFYSFATLSIIAGFFITMHLLSTDNYGYKFYRITSYLDPWADPLGSGYHLIQSLYAFGHGGLTGAGFGQSIQKLHYLPEAHNDFIFAIIGEELGFIGSSIFLLVYLLFLWRGLFISVRCPDIFGTLVGTGIVGMIGIQALVNIGGVTGAIPITGITLPFISFGGSSLVVTMLSMGILLSISRESSRIDKEKQSRTA